VLRAWPQAAPGGEQDPAVSVRAVFARIGRLHDLLAGWLFTGRSTAGPAGVTGGRDLAFRIQDGLWPVLDTRVGSSHLGSSCWHERTADAGGAGAGKDAAQARRAPAERRWASLMTELGLSRRPAGARAPRPAAGRDPLADPVAITERCVIGDQIRMPAAWSDTPGCTAWFADPAALGEADNRARAVAAGWCPGAWGRLVCPACRQAAGVMRRLRAPGQCADSGCGPGPTAAPPGSGPSRSPRVRPVTAGGRIPVRPGRHRGG